MKEIRDLLGLYIQKCVCQKDNYCIPDEEKIDKIIPEIKKIVLDMVGEDKPIVQNDDGFDNGFDSGYNYHGAEIRNKVEGEL